MTREHVGRTGPADTTMPGGAPETDGRPAEQMTVEELRADIQRTRAELAETVEALTARLDVKARARDAAGRARDRLKERSVAARDGAADAVRRVADRAGRDPVSTFAVCALISAASFAAAYAVWRRGRR